MENDKPKAIYNMNDTHIETASNKLHIGLSADRAIRAFEELALNVPKIGFLNHQKRIRAYLTVSKNTQQMIDDGEINEEEALFILSLLMRKHKNFQKAAMMAALNFSKLDKKSMSSLDRKYLIEVRKHLNPVLLR